MPWQSSASLCVCLAALLLHVCLQETTEGMGPEMTDLFVRYKELKKYLKAMKKQKQPGVRLQQQLQPAASQSKEEGRLAAQRMWLF